MILLAGFITALLRYTSHTIQFAHLRWGELKIHPLNSVVHSFCMESCSHYCRLCQNVLITLQKAHFLFSHQVKLFNCKSCSHLFNTKGHWKAYGLFSLKLAHLRLFCSILVFKSYFLSCCLVMKGENRFPLASASPLHPHIAICACGNTEHHQGKL